MSAFDNPTCLIWPSFPARTVDVDPEEQRIDIVDSWRAGGDYSVTSQAKKRLRTKQNPVDDSARARLTTMLIDMRDSGEEWPTVTPELIEEAITASDLQPETRADRLLHYMRTTIEDDPFPIPFLAPEVWPAALAHSESTTINELDWLLKLLAGKGLIKLPTTDMFGYEPRLTDAGIDHIATLSNLGHVPVGVGVA